MSSRKKLFNFLAGLDGAPIAQETAINRVAALIGTTPRLIRREIKVAKAAKAASQVDAELDITKLGGRCAFEAEANVYWIMHGEGDRWSRRARVDFLLHLDLKEELSRKPGKDRSPSLAERGVNWTQENCEFDVAVELGGLPAGIHILNGHRVLVPEQRLAMQAGPGNPTAAVEFIQNLLGKGQDPEWERQWIVFLGWMQWWRQAMAGSGLHRARAFLALIGPAGCGKSAFQVVVITPLGGGRQADAGKWLTGRTDFNTEMWNADHIILSDATLDERPGLRKKLRDGLKELVANPFYVRHPKRLTLRTLPHRWGVTLSANNDEASASIIPEVDDSTKDKFNYLRCYSPAQPYPAQGTPAGDAYWTAIKEALPAFAALVDNFIVPPEFADARWGVKAWRHPEIMVLVELANSDAEVGGLIDKWLAEQPLPTVSQTAPDLYTTLDVRWPSFSRTCRTPQLLGQALNRLKDVAGWKGRIIPGSVREGENRQNKRVWTLHKAAPCGAE